MDTLSQMNKALREGTIDPVSTEPSVQLLSHQKNVSVRILLSYLCSAGFLWLGYTYWPFHPVNLHTHTDRLIYTAQWQIPSVSILMAAVFTTGHVRRTNTESNPVGVPPSARLTSHKNFVTNTLEQLVLSVMAQLILTTYLDAGQMHLIPLLVTLFVIGRLQYWYGYVDPHRGRSNKAFGFAMSFYVTVGVLMYCSYRFVVALWG